MHLGAVAAAVIEKHGPRFQQATLHQPAERHARLGSLDWRVHQIRFRRPAHFFKARCSRRDIAGVSFNADEIPAQFLGHGAGGAGTEKRIQDNLAWFGRGQDHPVQK